MRPIKKGDEITFDYAMTEFESVLAKTTCFCASKRCRRRISGFSGLPERFKVEYGDYISGYLRKK